LFLRTRHLGGVANSRLSATFRLALERSLQQRAVRPRCVDQSSN
jgi:hypothetical protein